MIWNRGGKSCMWFCVFICTIFYLCFDGFYSNECVKERKNECNEMNKQLNSTLTCIATANIKELKENVDLKSGMKVREQECEVKRAESKRKMCAPEIRNGFFARCCCFAIFTDLWVYVHYFALSHSWISFRNHKKIFHLWNYDMAYQRGIESLV